MSKRGGNHPVPGHFKVQGGPVEERDTAKSSKQALGRQGARTKRRAGRKSKLGAAPVEQRAKEPPKPKTPPSSSVLAAVHDREFAKMNERIAPRAPKAQPPAALGDVIEPAPHYLSDTVRGVARRVAQVALAPLSLARAVVDRFRKHD
jgi:hypothetical protein